MIQKRDDKKPKSKELDITRKMRELDEYMRIFILPQIPQEQKEFRDRISVALDETTRAIHYAVLSQRHTRLKYLMSVRVELAMVEFVMTEIRDVCYRGKEKRRLDANSAKRFAKAAKLKSEVLNIVWGWYKNENKLLEGEKSKSKVVAAPEKEEL
ncbi:hypothetical protein IJG29_01915 [Candidatus Saccharibacteria bacterium]|nr:hypothetical protein [Candidatus Saccharibacteria bacterium]